MTTDSTYYYHIPNERRSTLGIITNEIACCCCTCAREAFCRVVSCVGCYAFAFLIILIGIYCILNSDKFQNNNSTTQYMPF